MVDVIAGRYEVGDVLGVGGIGRVHAARDRVLDRPVALKLVDADEVRRIDPAGRNRFIAEARTAAQFVHPNAVAVFDGGEADGWLYLAMELVDGETLAQRITRGPIPPAEARRIAADVLGALDAAHERQIIHRDVKPANILLDRRGVAKLADFGIAKRLDAITAAALTQHGQVWGTPHYLAPEQIDGRPVSAATDLYAMGVVLFEMVAGRPPFDRGDPLATAVAHREEPVPDLRRLAPGTPPALVEVIERALQKVPADRFPSAAAMRAALAGATTARTAAATPTVPVVRSAPATAVLTAPVRRTRRHRPWARIVALVLLLSAALAGVALAMRGSDPGESATTASSVPAAPETTVAVTSTSTTVSPTTTTTTMTDTTTTTTEAPPPTLVPLPLIEDVGGLIDRVETDLAAAGARGEELLERLREVDDRNGKKRRDAVRSLVEDLEKWVDDGEIDPELAAAVDDILTDDDGDDDDD